MEDISVHKIPFEGNILIIGYGAVARCTLPLLVTHIEVPISNITVIDALDKSEELASYIEKGLTFKVLTIGRANLASVLSQHLTQGDLLIDLAYEIDTLDLLKWCREAGVLYTNASVEEWDPFGKTSVYDKTLYYRHMRIREVTSNWVNKKGERTGATAVLDHGANPGLISHFVKKGLIDIAHAGLKDGKFDPVLAREITELLGKLNNKNLRREAFAQLAMKLDVKVIHCSERDTQISNKPRAIGEFVNTWSVEGLYEEGIAPAEMGWGTHERELPANSVVPPEGQRNQIFLDQWGMNTWVKSFVPPAHDIIGMVIRHGEAFTISEHLSVLSPDKNTTLYRPTVHYAYLPCDQAVASLHELRGRKSLQPKIRILDDRDITQGEDILGALLMGHAYTSWWTGSLLTIDVARKLVPGQNATTVQVASGLLGAILWMIRNPQEGVCVPDDLPHDFILNVAKPYLGDFLSGPHDWAPDAEETNRPLWQFSSFVYNM